MPDGDSEAIWYAVRAFARCRGPATSIRIRIDSQSAHRLHAGIEALALVRLPETIAWHDGCIEDLSINSISQEKQKMAFQTREDSVGVSVRRRIRRAASLSAAAAAFTALTVAEPAFAQETVIVEEEEEAVIAEDTVMEESVPNRGLIISGVVLLGATYGASAIVAANSDYDPDENLYIPIAGPWIDLAEREDCDVEGGRDCDNETTYKVLLVADGIGQAIGALQIVGGFVFPARRTSRTVETARLVVTPRVAPGHMGLSAMGTF